MAVRRDALDAVGGFESLADYCADDYVLGREVAESGRQVVMSHHVIDHVVINRKYDCSMRHQIRWMKSTRFSRRAGHAGTMLTFAMPFGLLSLIAAGALITGCWAWDCLRRRTSTALRWRWSPDGEWCAIPKRCGWRGSIRCAPLWASSSGAPATPVARSNGVATGTASRQVDVWCSYGPARRPSLAPWPKPKRPRPRPSLTGNPETLGDRLGICAPDLVPSLLMQTLNVFLIERPANVFHRLEMRQRKLNTMGQVVELLIAEF